jgi:hypothetical protein
MILLQILDEGSLTDSHGRKVDFKVRFLSFRSQESTLDYNLTLNTEYHHLLHE